MKKNRSEEEIKQPKKMTSIGGQALMEGLMMIGPQNMAMAVRLPNGSIHVETAPIGKSSKAAKIPFIRGSVKIFRQMVTGTRYLMRSASFIEDDIKSENTTQTEIMPESIDVSLQFANVAESSDNLIESSDNLIESSDNVVGENVDNIESSSNDAYRTVNDIDADLNEYNVASNSFINPDINNEAEISQDDNQKVNQIENSVIDETNNDSEKISLIRTDANDRKAKRDAKRKAKEQKGPGKFEQFLMKNTEILLYFSAIFGILLSVGLFILLPNLITNLTVGLVIDKNLNITNRIIYSLVEGVFRITIFIVYLAFASKLKDIKRVWMYHGAEHKTIACYESGLPLTIENTKSFSKHHPRCGTAFMFIILIISIIIFSFVPKINIIVDLLIRLACVPLLASLSYEVIHWAARHDNKFTRALSWPGLMLQRLTTKEPDDDMLEVAIAAMIPVIPAGERGDEW